jgi:hypothetical protein
MTSLDNLAAAFHFLGDTGIVRAAIVALVLFGLWRGLVRAGFTRSERVGTWLAAAIPLLAWFALIWQLALAGVMQSRVGALPLLPVAIFTPLVIGLPLILRSQRIAAALDALPASWLVGLQVYRVLGGAFLVQLALGRLSAAFALPAGIGDILVGVLALPAAFYLNRDEDRGRTIAVIWNLLGIFDLAVAITMGFLTSTGRLGAVGPGPLVYPLVMIPAFAVPLSLILHGVSLWQLKRRSNSAAAGSVASPAVAGRAA